MAFETGFKRLALPQPAKLSTVSVHHSTDAEDSPADERKIFDFDALKKKLGVDFSTECEKSVVSVVDWTAGKKKAIEKKTKRKKYNVKRSATRPVKFLYVYKARGFDNKASGLLFKELMDLVN